MIIQFFRAHRESGARPFLGGWPLVFFIGIFESPPALACAVCGFGDDSRIAFISTTALMTFVPLILIGGFVYWVLKIARKSNKSAEDRDFIGLDCKLDDPSSPSDL